MKLNLTYPSYLPGVVNSPVFVEGLCRWANDRRLELLFLEGDGGNGTYSAEDTFRGNGVTAIAHRYGMKCVSLSEKPWDWRETQVLNKTVRLPYSPFFSRGEYDRFVTAPLIKNHVFTLVTLGMKNLWGCIPDSYRMYYHYILDPGIVALVKELKPEFSIFDGLIALRGRGPMDGKPLDMNVVMASECVGSGEVAALHLMGIEVDAVGHLRLARKEGILPNSVNWIGDPNPYCRKDFTLDRSALNLLSIYLSRFPSLQKLVYHSPVSSGIYKIIDRLRPNSPQSELARARRSGTYTRIDLNDR